MQESFKQVATRVSADAQISCLQRHLVLLSSALARTLSLCTAAALQQQLLTQCHSVVVVVGLTMGQLGSSKVMHPASDAAPRHLADNTLHSNTQEINKAGKTKRDKLRSAPTAVGIFPGAPPLPAARGRCHFCCRGGQGGRVAKVVSC